MEWISAEPVAEAGEAGRVNHRGGPCVGASLAAHHCTVSVSCYCSMASLLSEIVLRVRGNLCNVPSVLGPAEALSK